MSTLRATLVMISASVLRPATPLSAQFQIPLPRHLPDTLVRLSHEVSCDTLKASRAWADTLIRPPQDTFTAVQDRETECELQRVIVASRLLPVDDKAVTRLFGGSALSALDQLGGGFAGSTAYVYSSLVAGNAGDFRFNFTFLRASSRADSTTGDQQATPTLRRASDRMTQLIMNGGEATGRFLSPHVARGGVNWQSSWGSYLSFGLLGSVEEKAPLPVAASLTTELQTSLAVRQPGNYKMIGDIYFALRPAVAYVFGRERVVAGRENRWVPFLQASVGVRTTEKLRYGVLYTLVPGSLDRYVPSFQLVAQTTLAAVGVK
jgi:hypothetical protein